MSTFSGLSIGISGLYANKRALDTTSHNIANANNPYYVRQQVIQSSSNYNQSPDGRYQLGTGVDIGQIRQIRNEFLDVSYRTYSQDIGSWSARNSVFEQVQEIFNEISDSGLQNVMDQFWNSWEELSKSPDNLTIRGLVKERSVAFIETVNHLSKQVDDLQVNLNRDINNGVNEINSIGKRIATLNEEIKKVETNKIKANDYRDERNSLIDRLSELVNINYYEDETGVTNVSIGGKQIVNSGAFTKLIAKTDGSSFVDVYWSDNNDKVNINNGEVSGLIFSRGDVQSTIIGKNNGSVNDVVNISFLHDNVAGIPGLVTNFTTDFSKRGFNPASSVTSTNASTANIQDIINHINTNKPSKLIISSNSDVNLTDAELDTLKELGIPISVIGDTSNSTNWTKIVNSTGGEFFNINDIAKPDFHTNLSGQTTNILSREMGTIQSYKEIIPSVKQKLNTFVNTLARNINYIHNQGITLDGNPGSDFFVSLNGAPIQADNIALNSNSSNLNNIAASSNGDKGNGFISEKIASVRGGYIFGELNIDGYYRDIISDIGVAASESRSMEDSTTMVRNEVDNRRKSISGVSLDEEMTDMLKYQHSYSANSRVINAIDEMIENIINRLGVVGR